jgi:hypothetical protein
MPDFHVGYIVGSPAKAYVRFTPGLIDDEGNVTDEKTK